MPPKAYTISKLAVDADVSIHMVRDYELRGLIASCERTQGGYRIYDEQALLRMKFVRFGMSTGVTLDSLGALFTAMDQNNSSDISTIVGEIEEQLMEKLDLSKQFCRLLKQLIHNKHVPDCTLVGK